MASMNCLNFLNEAWYFLSFCLYHFCYIHNVSADVSFGFLQVFHVEFGSFHETESFIIVYSSNQGIKNIGA